MKKFLLLFLFTINTSLGNGNFELKIGTEVNRSNYKIKTGADSILKWQDINLINQIVSFMYQVEGGTQFSLGLNYGMVQSGVMTDDDLHNAKSEDCESKKCYATFSVTKGMKGETMEIDLLASTKLVEYDFSKIRIISGLSYKNFYYKPNGYYQLKSIEGKTPTFLKGDEGTQYTNFVLFGPNLGFSFEQRNAFYNFEASLIGFVSLYAKSHQSHWGYEWDIKNGFSRVFGVDLKIGSEFKISNNVWLGVFTNVNYLRGTQLTECGDQESTECYGSIKYLEHLKTGIGINLKLK